MRMHQGRVEASHLALREPLSDSAKIFGITCKLLIPGRGEPIENGAVIVEDKKIVWVGHKSSLPSKYLRLSVMYHVCVLMPGLWDCHIHSKSANRLVPVCKVGRHTDILSAVHGFGPNGRSDSSNNKLTGSGALQGARAAKELERTLLAGFTSVREVSGFGGELAPAVEEGTIIGPNIYSSFASLSMTAGHADVHNLPSSTVRDQADHFLANYVCDGVPECIKGVRCQLRRGAKLIKVCATGGVGSLVDDPEDAEFSPEELKAIVNEAARAKRIVAAHCHGKEGIMNALNAGCRTIEHGSYLDEECIELMKKKGAILVATRLVIQAGVDNKNECMTLPGRIQDGGELI